ncbi:MAG TPA: hypothetical protein VHB77_14415 [Planctomycetaceae bacterium]|nr:hypothetical protein [Planctomycetaceae bacterium]
MLQTQLREGVWNVGQALRTPEEFADRWNQGQARYPVWVWMSLAATAILGTTTYGMTMGLLSATPGAVLMAGLKCTLAAGLSWGVSLPALYILNSLAGSRLRASTTLLAALVTTSWGGLAMIASIPLNWFFTAAVPHAGFVFLVNLVVFTGVGISMIDVFRRVMLRLEPDREQAPLWWLVLVGAIGCELFYFLGLFHFA